MSNLVHSFSLDAILEEHRRSRPENVASICEGQILTYAQLADRVIRLANALEDAGVGKGDRVLWAGQNHSGILECLIAAGKLGAMVCPLNWRQTAEEIAFVIDDLQPKIIIWQEREIGDPVKAALASAKHRAAQTLALDAQGAGSYEHFVTTGAQQERERVVDANLPALVIYTAAFEGRPNGAMLSQTAIMWQDLEIIDIQQMSCETRFLQCGPLFHIGSFQVFMAIFHIGGTNVFVRRWDTQLVAEAIQEHRCNRAFIFIQTAQELAKFNADGRYDLKSVCTASFCPEWDAMATIIPERSMFGYGQTEVTGLLAWTYYGLGKALGRFGKTGPIAQIRIFDDQGNELPQGETGEIVVRGPTVMQGYWNRPELNAQRHRNGWHRTNDLGRREADGSLSFIGPKALMIKTGVENVYPAEVEACLRSHPAVADCGVIGVPDEKWVQSVKAIVCLKPDQQVSADDLINHCRERIASYKKPRFIEFADSIPRLPSGGVDYALLDKNYGGGGYPGGSTRQH
ncbi:MAG: AMP-binding protein [Azonexus sp.]|jgi:long-chain acyl-CoA synthetase|nr:AMP-binding protein [Azonexus sp.]